MNPPGDDTKPSLSRANAIAQHTRRGRISQLGKNKATTISFGRGTALRMTNLFVLPSERDREASPEGKDFAVGKKQSNYEILRAWNCPQDDKPLCPPERMRSRSRSTQSEAEGAYPEGRDLAVGKKQSNYDILRAWNCPQDDKPLYPPERPRSRSIPGGEGFRSWEKTKQLRDPSGVELPSG